MKGTMVENKIAVNLLLDAFLCGQYRQFVATNTTLNLHFIDYTQHLAEHNTSHQSYKIKASEKLHQILQTYPHLTKFSGWHNGLIHYSRPYILRAWFKSGFKGMSLMI